MLEARKPVVVVLALVALCACATAGVGVALAASQRVKEHVTLKLVKRSGSTKFQHKGKATGTIAGSVKSRISLSHSVVLKGTVTIAAKGGSVKMNVDGRARSIALRTKFNGKATIVGGTGRYKNAKGTGTFTGVVNRSTWAATIDATGALTY